MNDHLPAHCCCHVLTRDCPVDCLRTVLSTAAFHFLARAEQAPFPSPVTIGQVVDLWQAGQLGLAAGLGPRRLGEIEAGLVLAGFPLTPAHGRPAGPGCGAAGPGEEGKPC